MYPETKEQRKAGMAALRARLYAAHAKFATDPRLTKKQRAVQADFRDQTREIQKRYGEV